MATNPSSAIKKAFKQIPAKPLLIPILGGCVLLALLWVLKSFFTFHVNPGEIGVVQNNMVGGIAEKDLRPGYHFIIPFVHRTYRLNGRYWFLHYSGIDDSPHSPVTIRTRDNNNVVADVSVPLRIREDGGHRLVRAGLHIGNAYEQRAHNTVTGVLRERLADLTSEEWYNVDRRREVQMDAVAALNEQLAEFQLEAEGIYVRSFEFPQNYENQLQEIQLLQQQALLDTASERRANAQQELDNYLQETQALFNQREAWWDSHQAVLENVYLTGIDEQNQEAFFDALVEVTLVNRRDQLVSQGIMIGSPEYDAYEATLRAELVNAYSLPEYLLGVEGINAQTNREIADIQGETNSLRPRYAAEAERIVAEIEYDGQRRINELLSSPGGRSLVALEAAQNLSLSSRMTFHSESIPFILDLQRMARALMGQ